MAKLFGAVGGIFLPIDPAFRGPWLAQSKALEDVTNSYLGQGWYEEDVRQTGVQLLTAGKVYFTEDDLGERQELQKLPYYCDFLIPFGLGYAIVIGVDTAECTGADGFALSLQFPFDRATLSTNEINLIYSVRGQITQAVASAAANAEDEIKQLVGHLSELSGYAETFDLQGKSVRSVGSTDAVSHQDRVLDAQIRLACSADPNSYIPTHLQTGDEASQEVAQILQLPQSLRHFFLPEKVVVLRSPAANTDHMRLTRLTDLYELTTAEAACLLALAKGNTTAEIADKLGVKQTTIQQRLKTIFEKTGHHTQAKLVTLFYTI